MHYNLEMKWNWLDWQRYDNEFTPRSHKIIIQYYEVQTSIRICGSLTGNSYIDIVIRLCQELSRWAQIVQQ